MSLTQAEVKKIEKIQKEIMEKEEEILAIKKKASEDITKLIIEFNLWKLDKKVLKEIFEKISKENNL